MLIRSAYRQSVEDASTNEKMGQRQAMADKLKKKDLECPCSEGLFAELQHGAF